MGLGRPEALGRSRSALLGTIAREPCPSEHLLPRGGKTKNGGGHVVILFLPVRKTPDRSKNMLEQLVGCEATVCVAHSQQALASKFFIAEVERVCHPVGKEEDRISGLQVYR